jgi:hypothetical protein
MCLIQRWADGQSGKTGHAAGLAAESGYDVWMYHALKLHPDSVSAAVERVEITLSRTPRDGLLLHYLVAGKIEDVLLPPTTPPARTDELWKHTCFEAFIRPCEDDETYYEINLAPSGNWAAYSFSNYRNGMRPAGETGAPGISTSIMRGKFLNLRAALDLRGLGASRSVWRLGISAIIEETNGSKSYWALAHPQGKPDFHHADSFVLDLPPEQT